MFDLISIGNIAIDLYFKDKSLTFKKGRFQLAVGGKYFTNYFYSGVGGGGANIAIGAHRNGLKTAVLGKIGNNPFKEVILHYLEKEDITTYFCQLEEEYINISAILLNEKGERTVINFNSPRQHIIKSKVELLKLEKTKAAYIGNLPDVSLAEKIELLYFFRQRKIATFVNLGVKDCRRPTRQLTNFLNKIDVLIVNGHEFSDLVKKSYDKIDFSKDVTNQLPILKELLLVVTEDKSGSFGYYQGKIYRQKAQKVSKIVDATGSGDAYTSAFIAEYLKSHSIESSMEKGTYYAAKILAKVGAN